MICGNSNNGIANTNPAQGVDIWLRFSVPFCPVQVEALRNTDPPPKKSFPQYLNGFIGSEVNSESE
jgi:hypothetical protein